MNALFIRLLEVEDKATALLNVIQNPDQYTHCRFEVDPKQFSNIPQSPFAYWASEHLRMAFRTWPALGTGNRTAKQGLATADDFRFVRASWEVASIHVGQTWFPFAKGGVYSPYYADVHLLVNWSQEGNEIRNNLNDRGQVRSNVWMLGDTAADYFFRPGLTWPRRTQSGLALRIMPSGCVFADKGPVVFVETDEEIALLALLAITNSLVFKTLVELQMAFGSYEVGVIQRTPIPNLTYNDEVSLSILARRIWSLKHTVDTKNETSHAFCHPALLDLEGNSLASITTAWLKLVADITVELTLLQSKVDDYCFELYGIGYEERSLVEKNFNGEANTQIELFESNEEIDERTDIDADPVGLVNGLISWSLGAVLGQWDLQSVIDKRLSKPPLAPLATLPICSPGTLQNDQGFPATPADLPTNYPCRISWLGILVEDSGHGEDIELRIRDPLRVIWPGCADAIEQEACEILGVASLRAYFANPNGFFDDHLKRYTKSRRVAPIYWPLATPSGSYTLWLYYHRLTDQTLYSCVNDFVEPKLAQVNGDLNKLRQRANRSRPEEKELERLSDLALELAAFRDELLRIARFWQPNLNDGVQITAAPLWRLFQHRGWQKRLKETWTALEAGDYDWAHLAYSIWPDRVRAKCKTDKSLAIAHDLEQLYVEPVKPVKAKKGGRKPQPVDEDEQGELL